MSRKRTRDDVEVDATLDRMLRSTMLCEPCEQAKKKECEHNACTVCLERMKLASMCMTPCGHFFCIDCLEEWATKEDGMGAEDILVRQDADDKHVSCPMCREDVALYYIFNEAKNESVETIVIPPKPKPSFLMERFPLVITHYPVYNDNWGITDVSEDDRENDEEDEEPAAGMVISALPARPAPLPTPRFPFNAFHTHARVGYTAEEAARRRAENSALVERMRQSIGQMLTSMQEGERRQ